MILNNVLNQDQRNEFLKSFFDTPENARNEIGKGNNRWGRGHVPVSKKFLHLVEPLVFSIYGPDYTSNDSYTRAYYNNSDLRMHTDRLPLDITVSVCLRRDVPWALNVSRKPCLHPWRDDVDKTEWLNEYDAYDLLPGQAVICLGNVDPHWRNTLICGPDQVNVYTFYHWTRNDKLHLFENK
jgi:hypothetical protein